MGKYGKSKLKKYCKIQSPWPIGVPRDYFQIIHYGLFFSGNISL
jgi:hypothetical protein